jgi:hypothetical protein
MAIEGGELHRLMQAFGAEASDEHHSGYGADRYLDAWPHARAAPSYPCRRP